MKASVKANIRLTKRIIVNGREYQNPEEMPQDVRKAYDDAMQNMGRNKEGACLSASSARIVFNGREYATEDEMPDEERNLYYSALGAVKAEKGSDYAALGREHQRDFAAPIEPTNAGLGLSRSKILLVLAVLAAFFLLYRLSSGY